MTGTWLSINDLGGFGSGKTFCGSLLGITLALKYAGIKGLVGAQTLPLLRDTTLATYIEHLDKLGCLYTYLKSENKLVFPNKSEILFRFLEEDSKLKSLNLGFIEIEEMSDTPESTFRMLLSRLRQEKKPEWGKDFKYRLFGHTNPQQSLGWIYEYFKKNPQPNYRRIIAPTAQNIYLPAGYLQSLKEVYSDEYYRINVLGEDCSETDTLVTKGFNKEVQVRSDLKLDKSLPIHITCDFNVDPMCWYIAQIKDGNIYYLYEVVRENTTTDATAQDVAELLYDCKHLPIEINGDASGDFRTTKGVDYVYLRNNLERNGFKNVSLKVTHKNPPIEYRISCWNNMIKGAGDTHHIFIHEQCKYLIYNIENLEVQAGTSKPKLPTASRIKSDSKAKFLGHPIDAASYLVCLYFPVKRMTVDNFKDQSKNMGVDIFGGKYDKRLI